MKYILDSIETCIKRDFEPEKIASRADSLAKEYLNKLDELTVSTLGYKKKSKTLATVEVRLKELQNLAQSIRSGSVVGKKEMLIALNVLRTKPNSKKRKVAEENAAYAVDRLRSNPKTNSYYKRYLREQAEKECLKEIGIITIPSVEENYVENLGCAHHRAFPGVFETKGHTDRRISARNRHLLVG